MRKGVGNISYRNKMSCSKFIVLPFSDKMEYKGILCKDSHINLCVLKINNNNLLLLLFLFNIIINIYLNETS